MENMLQTFAKELIRLRKLPLNFYDVEDGWWLITVPYVMFIFEC